MTQNDEEPTSESRRSFVQKGAVLSSTLALGLSSTGSVAAQQDETPTETPGGGGGEALMFNDEFHPGAQFRVTSPALDRTPDVAGLQQAEAFDQYETRVVEYLNTTEEALFFPADDAGVQEGTVYEFQQRFSPLDLDAGEGLVSVSFEPVPESEVLIPATDNQLEPVEDFDVVAGGGEALLRTGSFYPGALLRITSDVVEWSPREEVAESDIFAQYNTRHAEYLNTNDEFIIYPSHSSDLEPGAVYVIRKEYDLTDPKSSLITADLDRVEVEDLPEGLR